MGLSLEQLFNQRTEEESLAFCLGVLSGLGFQASSWQPGGIQHTLVRLAAKLDANLSAWRVKVAKAGYNDTAEGDALDFKSDDFDNQRQAGVKTRGSMVLRSIASAPAPFVIVPGQLVAADTATGARFRNLGGGTLSSDSTLQLLFEAEIAGRASNVADGTTMVLKTPLAGVRFDPLASDWLTQLGADEETDIELKTRNRTKWATLSAGGPAGAYLFWALSARPAVTRVGIDDQNPGGPGTIYVYVAGADGALPAIEVSAVDAYIKTSAPRQASPSVFSAVNKAFDIAGTLYIDRTYFATVTDDVIRETVREYFASVPVGGTIVDDPDRGALLFSGLYRTLMQVPGVVNVRLDAPLGDVGLATHEVAIANVTLSREQVN